MTLLLFSMSQPRMASLLAILCIPFLVVALMVSADMWFTMLLKKIVRTSSTASSRDFAWSRGGNNLCGCSSLGSRFALIL
jgi:hypothetical protein